MGRMVVGRWLGRLAGADIGAVRHSPSGSVRGHSSVSSGRFPSSVGTVLPIGHPCNRFACTGRRPGDDRATTGRRSALGDTIWR